MQDIAAGRAVRGFGPGPLIAAALFAPQAIATAQVLTENWGISQIIRTSGAQAGRWTVTLSQKPHNFLVYPSFVEDDATNYHFVQVESRDLTAGTFVVTHRSVVYASVNAGAPALSDAVDYIQLFVYGRSTL